jgi:hypothetical protein
LSVIKNIPVTERVKLQLRAEMFNLFNRINLASGAGSVGSDGTVRDTIGDFNGAPGLGPGELFNMQIAAKIIFSLSLTSSPAPLANSREELFFLRIVRVLCE